MIHELLKDVIGDFPGWLALFLQLVGKGEKPHAAAIEVARQRLPNIFGFGRTDEQLFESIRQLMLAGKRRFIDLIMRKMEDYEEDIFRLTVTGMQCGSEMIDKPVKNPPKGAPATIKESVSWEFTAKDLRVKYLEDIADEVAHAAAGGDEEAAAILIIEGMRSRRLITRNPHWAEATEWIKVNVLEFFDVSSFDEITEDMIAEKLKLRVEDLVRRHPDTLSIQPADGSAGSRERLQVKIPGVFSLMAKDVADVFSSMAKNAGHVINTLRRK